MVSSSTPTPDSFDDSLLFLQLRNRGVDPFQVLHQEAHKQNEEIANALKCAGTELGRQQDIVEEAVNPLLEQMGALDLMKPAAEHLEMADRAIKKSAAIQQSLEAVLVQRQAELVAQQQFVKGLDGDLRSLTVKVRKMRSPYEGRLLEFGGHASDFVAERGQPSGGFRGNKEKRGEL